MTCKAKSQNSDQQKLARMLAELNLTAAAVEISKLLADAAKQECSYSSFLKQVLKIEINGRFQRKLTRSIKRAKLGPTMSLDEFDFSVRRKLSPAAVKELLDCQWIHEGRNIICVGRPGTGKTHVAKALGHAACMKGLVVYYLTATEILEQMHAALADNTYQKVFRRYTRADLLIAEELGYLPLDKQKADYLFRLVSTRHPHRAMIVTANTGFENWGNFFPSKAQAIATIDRLVDQATILRFTGKSFRKPKDIQGANLEDDK